MDAVLKWQIAGWILLYVILVWFVITSRKKKFQSLAIGTLAISSGALLSIGVHDVNWLTGSGQVSGSYSRWTEMKHGHHEMLIPARLSLHIGLSELNVSLKSYDPRMRFYYNEHFDLRPRHRTNRDQYNSALYKGIPNPILSVLDFIIFNDCYFKFTQVGYMTRYMLSGCGIIWAVNLIIFLMIPEISAKVGLLNSLLIFISTLKYIAGVDVNFDFFVEGRDIHVTFGRSVFMVLLSALLQAIPAFLVWINMYPRTSFEVDFDSPFDREVLTKSSQGSKQIVKPPVERSESFMDHLRSSHSEPPPLKEFVIDVDHAEQHSQKPDNSTIPLDRSNTVEAQRLELDSSHSTEHESVALRMHGEERACHATTACNSSRCTKVQRSTEDMLAELRAKPSFSLVHKPSGRSDLHSSRRQRSVSIPLKAKLMTVDRQLTKEQILLRSKPPREVRRRSPSRTRTTEPSYPVQKLGATQPG